MKVAAICLITIHLLAQPQIGSAQQSNASAQQANNSATLEKKAEASTHEQGPQNSPPQWYTSSEWWLVIIAALTGFAIAYQAGEMTRATDVMQKQAILLERQINKERAHVRIEIVQFKPQYPEVASEDSAVQEIHFNVKFFGATAFIDGYDFAIHLEDFERPKTDVLRDNMVMIDFPEMVATGSAPIDGFEPLVFSRYEVDSLFRRKAFIHFRASVRYHDFSEVPRQTTAYYIWHGMGLTKNGRVISIGHWNRAGRPEDNQQT